MESATYPVIISRDGGAAPDAVALPPALATKIDRILVSSAQIAERMNTLADEIRETYAGVDEVVAVVVLKGAFIFAADLGRAVVERGGPEVHCEFMRASAYGADVKGLDETERDVCVELKPGNMWGKHVLLIEDIVDQGFTLARVQRILEDEGAASVKICTLLLKHLDNPTPEVKALRDALVVDFVGFEVPDEWIVGYGTDAGEDYRMLPHIVTLR